MNATLTIATAQQSDETAWRQLWSGFLDFYCVTLPESTTNATWTRIIDPNHPMTCRMAWENGAALGFAIHHSHCSTWVPGNDLYLEDLFVTPAARGKGIGRALLEDLITVGRSMGCHRLYWNTEATNDAARKLYDQFCKDDGHIRYRMRL